MLGLSKQKTCDGSGEIGGYRLAGIRGLRRRKCLQERLGGSKIVLSGEPVRESPRNSMSCGGFSLVLTGDFSDCGD